ncbi:hypothetical protein N7452_004223 [Penicillium brevicompactum]|uniref:Uncharacterized protein n=1 Tax=Penicillium brevicompactum TaxID=5074 RepID=A0A9W9QVC9_PENBR|nr:hypothetical protein N7452_004223 [Penicillium brevicompactum]
MAKAKTFRGPLDSDVNAIDTNDATDSRGTKANPIVIKEDSEGSKTNPIVIKEDSEGSETNPIVINDDADTLGKQEMPVQYDPTRDTEPLGTPEFWAILGNLSDQGFHVPKTRTVVADVTCDLPPSQSVYGQISDHTCSPEPESLPLDHMEEERSEVAKSDNDKETQPNKDESCCRIAKINTTSCGQPNLSLSSQGDKLEPSIQTSQTDDDNPPHPQRSGKRKRGHEEEKNAGNRRSKRLANKGKLREL